MDQAQFVQLLTAAVQHGASDIHLSPAAPPALRIRGELINVKSAPLTDSDIDMILKTMISDPSVANEVTTLRDYDGSFEVKNLCRFRFNIYSHRGRKGAILRVIPAQIPSIELLGLPPVLNNISSMQRGLVLVTGATGSGKSSTLAAMVNYINTHQPVHILTIEDPIEYLHTPVRARITQREIGRDTTNFAIALRAALRQDPDVILVGEMRDPETIDIALKAAETGHLVFSTVHTTDAIKTIGRLVAVFPPNEQAMVRIRLADNLVATVSQRLIKRRTGKGLVAAQEIMVVNSGISESIANPQLTGQINDLIAKQHGSPGGGMTFEQHLVDLYRGGMITLEAAKEASTNPSDFERNLRFGNNAGGGAEQDDSQLNMGAGEKIMLDNDSTGIKKSA
jgi:twitching motility protein PilT